MRLLGDLVEDIDWRVVGTSTTSVKGKIVDWGIQVLQEGPYKDIILIYGDMKIDEAEDATEGKLIFDFDIFQYAFFSVYRAFECLKQTL